jgi:phosphate transport system permease protein
MKHRFQSQGFDYGSTLFTGITGLATALILVLLFIVLGNIFLNGWEGLSWRFISTISKKDFFEPGSAAVLPMIVGTTIRVFLMTLFVLPVGVITAVYLFD